MKELKEQAGHQGASRLLVATLSLGLQRVPPGGRASWLVLGCPSA